MDKSIKSNMEYKLTKEQISRMTDEERQYDLFRAKEFHCQEILGVEVEQYDPKLNELEMDKHNDHPDDYIFWT